MKKGTFVVAMVVVFIIAMAGTAYATWANSGYTNWSTEASAAATGNPANTPHAGYISTSKNCAVCHAVHKASNTGQVLLQSTVADACTYCHIGTGPSTLKVYSSSEANYNTDTIYNHAKVTYDGVTAGATCTGCHSVHSANTAADGRNILRIDSAKYVSAQYQWNPGVKTGVALTAADESGFCSQCHPYYNRQYNGTSHVMTDTVGGYTGSGTITAGTAVATATSQYCNSCHNASSGYPHLTAGAGRFISDGVVSGTSPNQKVNNDGVCLRCHGGATGVGTNF